MNSCRKVQDVAAPGGFNPRPVLSINLAAERRVSVVNRELPALHDILEKHEKLLSGQVKASDDRVRM